MNNLLNFFTDYHLSTKRNYFERMANQKIECMRIARKFEKAFRDRGSGFIMKQKGFTLIELLVVALNQPL